MGSVDPDGLSINGGSRAGIKVERLWVGGGGGSVVSSLDEHTTRSHFPLGIVC